MSGQRAVLVVAPSWVGDMVMAQSLFMLLRERFPERPVDVLAPAWSAPLLARMPQVRRFLEMPCGHGELGLRPRLALGRQLRGAGYGQAIVLPNSLKSALVPWLARIPCRTGWRGEWRYGLLNDLRVLDPRRYPLMVDRFVALAGAAGEVPLPAPPWPRLQVDASGATARAEAFGLKPGFVALCPGAEYGPAKRWPPRHYARVATALLRRGRAVALLGSANDRPVAAAIRAAVPAGVVAGCVDLTGRTHLEEALDLMAVASLVVSNDSGLMHVAAALDRPLVVLYGPTSPGFTPPLARRVAILHKAMDCGPCFRRECPLGHQDCLRGLAPERVLAAADEWLEAA